MNIPPLAVLLSGCKCQREGRNPTPVSIRNFQVAVSKKIENRSDSSQTASIKCL